MEHKRDEPSIRRPSPASLGSTFPKQPPTLCWVHACCFFSCQLLGWLPLLCHDGAGGLPRGSHGPLGQTEKGVPKPEFPWEFVWTVWRRQRSPQICRRQRSSLGSNHTAHHTDLAGILTPTERKRRKTKRNQDIKKKKKIKLKRKQWHSLLHAKKQNLKDWVWIHPQNGFVLLHCNSWPFGTFAGRPSGLLVQSQLTCPRDRSH